MRVVKHHQGDISLGQLSTYECSNNFVSFDSGCTLFFDNTVSGRYCLGNYPNGTEITFLGYDYLESAIEWIMGFSSMENNQL